MNKAKFSKDEASNTLIVERSFAAPWSKVWEAWTKSELLDQWWGPKPWNAVTKTMDFREGGRWIYAMTGPDGSKQWCVVQYKTIDPEKEFTGTDAFSDESGELDTTMPVMEWRVVFEDEGEGTKITVTSTYASLTDMQKIVEMGFQEGFSMGLNQLEVLLAQ